MMLLGDAKQMTEGIVKAMERVRSGSGFVPVRDDRSYRLYHPHH
jgi:hypothetical protein